MGFELVFVAVLLLPAVSLPPLHSLRLSEGFVRCTLLV